MRNHVNVYVYVFFIWIWRVIALYTNILSSKFMTSQTGKQAITIHNVTISPNISRSKGNQIMKCGQLIKYNMRNIFLKKSYTKCGGEATTLDKTL